MKTGCGCREISSGPIEFEIHDCCPQVHINCGPLLPNTNDIDWCNLQSKVICDIQKVIKQLECGIQPDIEIILEEISLIFMNSCGYNIAKKMYSTDLEEDYFLRHNNFLSEFETQEEKDQVLLNLGIYDKINDMITKSEVDNIIENTVTEVNIVINNKISEVLKYVDKLNEKLDTKIGFVVRIGKLYYGFASSIHYGQWLEEEQDLSSNLILATWIGGDYVPNQYTIIFNTLGGDNLSPVTVLEEFPITFPTPTWNSDPTRIFAGWYSEYNPETEEFSGDLYYSGDKIIPKGPMVFYARWVRESKTLKFYPNYDDLSPIVQNEYLLTTINLPQALNRTGYTFFKWNTKLDGSGSMYDAGSSYNIIGDQDFYAQWNINQYTITFHSNYFGIQDQTITVDYNTPISSITFPTFTRDDGYILKEWTVEDEPNIPTVVTKNLVFNAVWELGFKYKLSTTIPTEEPTWNYSEGKPTTLGQLEGWNEWKNNRTQYIVFPYKDSDNVDDYFEHIESLTQSSFSNMYEKENSNISEIIIFRFRIERTRQPLGDGNMTDIIKIK